jgi:hypothetical protein
VQVASRMGALGSKPDSASMGVVTVTMRGVMAPAAGDFIAAGDRKVTTRRADRVAGQ